jgi:hypothetical protein
LQPAASTASGSSAAVVAAAGAAGVGGTPGVTSAAAVTSPSCGAGEAGDGWELVSEDVPSEALPAAGSVDADTLQSLVERLSQGTLDILCYIKDTSYTQQHLVHALFPRGLLCTCVALQSLCTSTL